MVDRNNSIRIILAGTHFATNSHYRMPTFRKRKKSDVTTTRKYSACPCGSGKRYKWCCMPKDFPEKED